MKPQLIPSVPDETLTRAQVAAMFKVTKHTIRMYERRGQLTALRINARMVRYELPEVRRLLDVCRV